MADYQSLLTRAVANLPNMSSAATRQAIYDRARKALLTQLRTLRPPLPESDIAREEKALDQAIALVEAKFGATDPVPSEPAPAATATPTAGSSGGAGSTGSAAPRTGPTIPALFFLLPFRSSRDNRARADRSAANTATAAGGEAS